MTVEFDERSIIRVVSLEHWQKFKNMHMRAIVLVTKSSGWLATCNRNRSSRPGDFEKLGLATRLNVSGDRGRSSDALARLSVLPTVREHRKKRTKLIIDLI